MAFVARLSSAIIRRAFFSGVTLKFSSSFTGASKSELLREQIIEHTKPTKSHLTPEISLHLITSDCELYHSRAKDSPFVDPYWAFYWPGGQAVARFILDNRDQVRGKRVLDFGSGCGAASIASLMSGAVHVTANDTDPNAAVAVNLNLDLNEECRIFRNRLQTDTRDLVVGSEESERESSMKWDLVAVGDMLYDVESVDRVSQWLRRLHLHGSRIIVGDPGRLALENHSFKRELEVICSYSLPPDCIEQNRGMSVGYVWTFK